MGYRCRNGSISEKVQKISERSILMKCSVLNGGLSSNIHFLTFKIFYMVSRLG